MTRTKALLMVLVFLACSAGYADVQVFMIGSRVGRNQRADTRALCAFRNDLRKRVTATRSYLASHPEGIAGISAATIRVSLNGQQSTLRALSPLVGHC